MFHNFGFEFVTDKEKTKRIKDLFTRVTSSYDFMNDVMTAGLHRCWKRDFIKKIPLTSPQAHVLDMASGTADIVLNLREKYPLLSVTACDLSYTMLTEGRNKCRDKGLVHHLDFIVGNAQSLPFATAQFDVYLIVFGLRNVGDRRQALSEAYRVLKPGGVFMCMELGMPSHPTLEKIYTNFSHFLVPRLGAFFAQDRAAYQYLVESIQTFPKPQALLEEMSMFERVEATPYAQGICHIFYGYKAEL